MTAVKVIVVANHVFKTNVQSAPAELPEYFSRAKTVKFTSTRTVSVHCSARVSRVGLRLSTKQVTEPYSDNLLNRTWNPSEPHSDKEVPLEEL